MPRGAIAAVVVAAALLSLPVGAAAPVHADFEAGVAAYDRKDFATASAVFLDLAELGDAPSQQNLGAMALRGEGRPRDRGQALGWLRAARENGREVSAAAIGRLEAEVTPSERASADAIVDRYGARALQATVLPDPEPGCTTLAPAATAMTPPKLLSGPTMRLPPNARGGPVFLLVGAVLGIDGVPRDVTVLASAPPQNQGGAPFAEEVLRTIPLRRYAPATLDGRPAEAHHAFRVTFSEDVGGETGRLPPWVRERAEGGVPYYRFVSGATDYHCPRGGPGGERADGLRQVLAAAQVGDAEAQLFVGSVLARRCGEAHKALPWLRRAAAAGRPEGKVAYALALLGSPAPALAEARDLMRSAPKVRDPALRRRALAALACSEARDPDAAMALARSIALTATIDPRTAEAVAAARAAGGDFQGAEEAQQVARDRATALRWDVSAIEARLEGYRGRRPCTGGLVEKPPVEVDRGDAVRNPDAGSR